MLCQPKATDTKAVIVLLVVYAIGESTANAVGLSTSEYGLVNERTVSKSPRLLINDDDNNTMKE